MDKFNQDIRKSLTEAQRYFDLYSFAMQVFQANAQRHDFAAAEAERPKMHALLDDYLDAFMAANKRVEVENNGRTR